MILEYIPAKNILEKVHQETFGKSGCRRIVPGQYLAIDPKGRAVMIGKLVCRVDFQIYVLTATVPYLLSFRDFNMISSCWSEWLLA